MRFFALATLSLTLLLGVPQISSAQYTVPPVDLNAVPTGDGPFGAFKLVQCDGPENLNHITSNGKIDKNYKFDLDGSRRQEFINQFQHEPPFVPCNFRGLMMQVQFLINVMLILGVLAVIGMSVWAGFLMMTGVPAKMEKAKGMFPKIFWGFIIMLTAWFIVYQILQWLTCPPNTPSCVNSYLKK